MIALECKTVKSADNSHYLDTIIWCMEHDEYQFQSHDNYHRIGRYYYCVRTVYQALHAIALNLPVW